MNIVVVCGVVCAVCAGAAAGWQWPEPAASVRIDTKVRFIDDGDQHSGRAGGVQAGGVQAGGVQADEVFEAASDTDGFYNRPAGAGRYPVRVHSPPPASPYSSKSHDNDGTLDSLQYCKCVSDQHCGDPQRTGRACSAGKSLCCYRGRYQAPAHNTEYFNEIEDERPSLLPGREDRARPFPPPPGVNRNGLLVGPGGPTGPQAVLVGPGGPTGNIGPAADGAVKSPGVLIGPGGPTGLAGAHAHEESARLPHGAPDVLVGPDGPTGVVGPAGHNGPRDVGHSETAQRGVLVGPGGPTGIIGPAQRGVLVGPGGPTGVIGPRGYGQQRPVLVGPGGPTGFIGPRGQSLFNDFFGQQRAPRLLVGPGGPTGVIGPGRQLLVGPGGPTGRIGPQNYFV